MAPKADSKRISNNFATFIVSFLVFTTLVVFAVLLFLSYENMYNNLVINISNGTELAASDLAVDISTTVNTSDGSFSFTKDNDGSSNFTNSRIIERFVSSSMYRESGAVYLVNSSGRILCRSKLVGENGDSFSSMVPSSRRSNLSPDAALFRFTTTG